MKSAIPISASFLLFAASVAHAGEPGTYEYSTDYWSDSESVTITGYEPDGSSELIVPAEFEGKLVTSIGAEAFKGCKEVTSVVLPEGLISLQWQAFADCTSLVSITLPPGLTEIGEGVFFNCRSLTEVTLPGTVSSIGRGAFFGTGLRGISIPPDVTAIGSFAFSRCADLESIRVQPGNESFSSVNGVLFDAAQTILYRCPEGRSGRYRIPEGVTTLSGAGGWYADEGAFENCALLESISLPDSLLSIGGRSFRGCHSVTGLSIPEQVAEIGVSAFDDCQALTALEVAPGNPNYRSIDGALLNGDGTELVRCLDSNTGHYKVPAGVTVLGYSAFANCAALTSIDIPEGVTAVQNSVFIGCGGLEYIQLPSSLAELGSAAFSGCPRLSEIEVADGSQSLQSIDGAVYDRGGSELLVCPPGRAGVFVIPKGVTAIASNAFHSCQQLSRIVIPAGVESLDRWFFSECSRLESIEVADENANYASVDGALYDDAMTSILFCPRAKTGSYRIPDGVETVSWSAFEQCASLTGVTLPSTLTLIDGYSFRGCTALREINLPESLTEIRYDAFRACSSLVEITLPRNLATLYTDAFIGNTSLEAIDVAPGNESFSSIDGVLFNADGTTLIRFPRAKVGDYTIPASVTEIRGRAYWPPECGFGGWGWWGWGWSPYADAVRIGDDWVLPEDPYSTTGQGEEGYDYYEDYYGEGAFEGCHGLTSIRIPEGVVSIGHFAFYRATGLSSIVVPRSVNTLHSWALAGNASLREVRFTGDVPNHLGWSVFADAALDLAIDYRLKMVSIVPRDESSWDLQWTSIPGYLYAVEVSEDLQNWTTVETDIAAWGSRGYYRVVTDPELGAGAFRVRSVGRE